jgi:tRNA G18 (ribose-2'-O)-methylase SpoU
MVTDRYLKISHHPSVSEFADVVTANRYVIIGVDNLEGAIPLESYELPQRTCLVFGSEGPGLTDELVAGCKDLVAITQHGSTRSLNAGAAAAIAMYHWALRWAAH